MTFADPDLERDWRASGATRVGAAQSAFFAAVMMVKRLSRAVACGGGITSPTRFGFFRSGLLDGFSRRSSSGASRRSSRASSSRGGGRSSREGRRGAVLGPGRASRWTSATSSRCCTSRRRRGRRSRRRISATISEGSRRTRGPRTTGRSSAAARSDRTHLPRHAAVSPPRRSSRRPCRAAVHRTRLLLRRAGALRRAARPRRAGERARLRHRGQVAALRFVVSFVAAAGA